MCLHRAGAEETLVLTTAVGAGHQGPVGNTATVSAPDESGAPEADVTNNESSATAVLAGDGLIDTADPSGTGVEGDSLPRTGFAAIP